MPEYVTRPDRKVGSEPQSIVKYFAKLNRQGLSHREIAARYSLGRSTVGDYVRGRYSPPRTRAASLAEAINRINSNDPFSIELPNRRQKTVTVDPINKAERTKAREYHDEILKLARGQEYDLSKFKGKSIRVRGKNGIEEFRVVVEEDVLTEMAKQGQYENLKFFRGSGS